MACLKKVSDLWLKKIDKLPIGDRILMSFKVGPLRLYTLSLLFSPLSKSLMEEFFWIPTSCSILFTISSLLAKRDTFNGAFNFGNKPKSQGAMSEKYGDWRRTGISCFLTSLSHAMNELEHWWILRIVCETLLWKTLNFVKILCNTFVQAAISK